MDLSQQITAHFTKACGIKDAAIRALDDLELYKAAALEFKLAADGAKHAAETLSSTSPDDSTEARAYAEYYLYEHFDCLANYHYEQRDTPQSKLLHERAVKHLSTAITHAGTRAESREDEIADKLKTHMRLWLYMQRSDQAKLSATEARGAWDNKDYITALDHYKRASRIEKQCIEIATQDDLAPRYIRISQGNYIGMMANASSALAMFYVNTGSDPERALSPDTLCFLVAAALDAYELGTQAVHANPEWEQYRTLARVCRDNIAKLLEDNPKAWSLLLARLANDSRLEGIMKEVDPERTSSVLGRETKHDPKIVRLWAAGTLWLLVVVVVSLLVLLLASQDFGFFRFALVVLAVEILVVLSGAFILRSLGDLSEESFVTLIKLALSKQLQMIKQLPSGKKEQNAEPEN